MRISAKFSPLKNGCFLTSAAPRFEPSRRAGSLFSKPDIKSRAWSSRPLAGVAVGNARGFFTMFRSVASFDAPAYGINTPNDHQSTALPWDRPEATSGETYSWVPTKEHDRAETGSATKSRFGSRARISRERKTRFEKHENGLIKECERVLQRHQHLRGIKSEKDGGERETIVRVLEAQGVQVSTGTKLHDDAGIMRGFELCV
ncbi:hypothetical protein CR513_22264, partial [Mucuna pruriens]